MGPPLSGFRENGEGRCHVLGEKYIGQACSQVVSDAGVVGSGQNFCLLVNVFIL